MKNVKNNLCLADFENELENLNHFEMKELVGGTYESYSGNSGASYQSATNAYNNYINYVNFNSNVPKGSATTSHASSGSSVTVIPVNETPKDDKTPTIWHGLVPTYYMLK